MVIYMLKEWQKNMKNQEMLKVFIGFAFVKNADEKMSL